MSDNLSYVYALILDVLGYRKRLEEDRTIGNLTFKDSLQNALKVLTDINEVDYNYQAISDTIIITCSDRDNFINFLLITKMVILSFLREGLFVRGGIAYAKHFKSTYITYSHAIALAHEIEAGAIYPRVVIDNNIIDMFDATDELNQIIDSKLILVSNGIYFINILDEDNWGEVYKCCRELYKNQEKQLSKNEHNFLKHSWFEEYIFSSLYADSSCGRYIPKIHFLDRCDLLGPRS